MLNGTGSLSLRKQDLVDQKNIATGFTKTQWAHKANAGDTGINLNSLTLPPEMSTNGFTNPTGAQLAGANLLNFRRNLRLISSVRGMLIDQLSYTLGSGTQINFIGFTALAGEIFVGTIDYTAVTGLQVVSATGQPATGVLAAGSNTFNIGFAVPTNQYSTTQIGGVLVYLDGVLQTRNTGNSSTVLDGNYYEQDNGSGNFSQIVFNVTDPSTARNVLVIPNGLIVPQPDGSITSTVQTQQGQINQLAAYVAALTGLSQATVLGGSPSYTDLLAFGNLVNSINQTYANLTKSNNWTAAQAIPGRTDGSSVPAGDVGETITTPVASSFVTTTADTYVDGQTFTLQPGLWRIDVDVPLELGWVSGATTQVLGYVGIRQGSTVLNQALIRDTSMTSTQQNVTNQIHLLATVNITSPTTYKLSVLCNQSNTLATARVYADNTNFTGTNGTANSKIICTRVG